jgi:hypothetical protein
MANSKMAFV